MECGFLVFVFRVENRTQDLVLTMSVGGVPVFSRQCGSRVEFRLRL